MIGHSTRVAVLLAALGGAAFAADEAPKGSVREALRARMAEDAKKAETKKAPPTSTAPASTTPPPSTPAPASTNAEASAPAKTAALPAKDAKARPAQEPPTVLPKVEVKKGRITVLDQQLAKQEQDIEREKKNLKTSEVDAALNDSKVARPLAIFGGESTQFRKRVASERVELMEAEKDILEAIARAKTKEERAELQKQLDEIKAMRRELDKTLR